MESRPYFVSELRDENRWQAEALNNWFYPHEAIAISKIPITSRVYDDMWSWNFSKNGCFTVRSAYFVELQNYKGPSTSRLHEDVNWNLLWDALIPPKIKTFGWRILKGGLPVMQKLRNRGMKVEPWCTICGEDIEDISHLLFSCPVAVRMWKLSPLRLEFDPGLRTNALDWIVGKMETVKELQWWSHFWSLAWSIWKMRNSWVFEKKKLDLKSVLDRAVNLVHDYDIANKKEKKKNNQPRERVKWNAPSQPCVKLNTDAAIFHNDSIGLGAVLRDYIGDVLMATCVKVEAEPIPELAEALALRHGLSTSLDAGFHCIVVETDCLKLVNQLNRGTEDRSAFGMVAADIMSLAGQCSSISFLHAGREGNYVAHALAHLSSSFPDLRVWLEEIPNQISGYVLADVMLLPT